MMHIIKMLVDREHPFEKSVVDIYDENTGAENENSTAGDDADQGKTDSAANKKYR